MKFDARITPIKSNLAASNYKYIVKRVKYSKGKKYTVACSFAPLYSNKNSKLSKYKIGIVPQELNIDPFFSPVELLELQVTVGLQVSDSTSYSVNYSDLT